MESQFYWMHIKMFFPDSSVEKEFLIGPYPEHLTNSPSPSRILISGQMMKEYHYWKIVYRRNLLCIILVLMWHKPSKIYLTIRMELQIPLLNSGDL